ncbi:tetratricopeptide repeat protein [Hydrogenophaga sp. 5NK40-0174]|uniref:tetratricopeptide repeat protein n=1 Tax=Hydrogenophaga sp. 5NK40-0174 TaxID=3127649 RepID=UPI003109A16B
MSLVYQALKQTQEQQRAPAAAAPARTADPVRPTAHTNTVPGASAPRRWGLVWAGVALAGVGVASGVVIAQWGQDTSAEATAANTATSTSPAPAVATPAAATPAAPAPATPPTPAAQALPKASAPVQLPAAQRKPLPASPTESDNTTRTAPPSTVASPAAEKPTATLAPVPAESPAPQVAVKSAAPVAQPSPAPAPAVTPTPTLKMSTSLPQVKAAADADPSVRPAADLATVFRDLNNALALNNAKHAGEALATIRASLPATSVARLRAEAWYAFQTNDLPTARDHYQSLLEKLPGDEQASLNLAALERQAQRPQQAQEVLQQALRHNPNAETIRTALSQIKGTGGLR